MRVYSNTAYRCRTCGIEGKENFYGTAKYQCKSCFNKRCVDAGKERVESLKLHYGGKCVKCGYNKCLAALQFHHRDPSQKEFHLGYKRGISWDRQIEELNKCDLICANCHAEIHYSIDNPTD